MPTLAFGIFFGRGIWLGAAARGDCGASGARGSCGSGAAGRGGGGGGSGLGATARGCGSGAAGPGGGGGGGTNGGPAGRGARGPCGGTTPYSHFAARSRLLGRSWPPRCVFGRSASPMLTHNGRQRAYRLSRGERRGEGVGKCTLELEWGYCYLNLWGYCA